MKILYFRGKLWIPASRKVLAVLFVCPLCQAGGEERQERLGFPGGQGGEKSLLSRAVGAAGSTSRLFSKSRQQELTQMESRGGSAQR